MMKTRPVVSFYVCALEVQIIFKMAAKFTLKLPILLWTENTQLKIKNNLDVL